MTLHDAAGAGDLTAALDRLATGDPVDARDGDGLTPLMVASRAGRLDVIAALIAAGARTDLAAEPHDFDDDLPATGTPEGRAVRFGLFSVIGPIVGAMGAVRGRRKSGDGPTALMVASTHGHANAVEALIAAGADLDRRDRDGFTALGYAAALGREEVARVLLNAGAEVDPVDHFDLTPITLAAIGGNVEAVRVLAGAGARFSATKRGNLGPLHSAAYRGHAAVVQALLDAGADPDEVQMNRTAMEWASSKQHGEVVRVLAARIADPDAENSRKLTPLTLAVANQDAGSVHALLRAGASPGKAIGDPEPGLFSGQSLPGRATALHLAACLADPEIAAALLEAGADPAPRDALGFTPLMLAVASGHDEVAGLLRRAAEPADEEIPVLRDLELVAAVRRGDHGRVVALLDAGASPDARTHYNFRYHYLIKCEAVEDFSDWNEIQGDGSYSEHERPVLTLAVELGHEEIAATLIAAGARVEPTPEGGLDANSPLIAAAVEGHLASVVALIAAGADVNAVDPEEGQSVLGLAARAGHSAIVRTLIAVGAEPDGPGRRASTPLHEAITHGHVEAAKALLEAEAKVTAEDLGASDLCKDVEFTRLLLEADPDGSFRRDPGVLPDMVRNGSVETVRLLLDAGFDPAARGEGVTPAIIEAIRRSEDLVVLLLDAGADVDATDPDGRTALALVAMGGSPQLARLLIERGAAVDHRCNGRTPLIRAAGCLLSSKLVDWYKDKEKLAEIQAREDEMIRTLIELGADVEARDDQHGRTPLMHAAAEGCDRAVRLLLRAGAALDATDWRDGRTPLMLAAEGGHLAVVNALLEAGAAPEIEDDDGRTAASLAGGKDKAKVVALLGASQAGRPRTVASPTPTPTLRKAATAGNLAAIRSAIRDGADVDARLARGRTALMVAVEGGRVEVVEALLDAGANPDIRDLEGRTSLIAAIKRRDPRVVRLLLRAGAHPDAKGERVDGLVRETPLIAAIGERCTASTNAWQDVVNGFADECRVETDLVEIVQALIEAGVSVDAEDENGVRPLWYALDLGQDEIAAMLAEAGAGREPVGAAYLRARSFATLAATESFRESARALARACQAEPEPEPLVGRLTERDLRAIGRDGPFPEGPTIGATFTVPADRAESLIEEHQGSMGRNGILLFRASRYVGSYDFGRHQLGLLPTADKYEAIAALCTSNTEGGYSCPGLTIRDVCAIEADHPFRLIGCEGHLIELEFAKPIADVPDLARRLRAIQVGLSCPGMDDEDYEIEGVIEALGRQPRVTLSW